MANYKLHYRDDGTERDQRGEKDQFVGQMRGGVNKTIRLRPP